jgi:acyl-CoA synthetase (AMP-forming)/AMP-acid ligase II
MYLTQGLRRAAQIRPREESTVFRDRRRVWSETADRVARIAGGLKEAGAIWVPPGVEVDERVWTVLEEVSEEYAPTLT